MLFKKRRLNKEHQLALEINYAIDVINLINASEASFAVKAKAQQQLYSSLSSEAMSFIKIYNLVAIGKTIFGNQFTPTPRHQLDSHIS